MCLTRVVKITKIINQKTAEITGGSRVYMGSVKHIKVGDCVSVYGPMILEKIYAKRH